MRKIFFTIAFLAVSVIVCSTGLAQLLPSDNFNRANENPIASPWIATGAFPLPRLFSNTMTVASTTVQSDIALYSGITWPNDQYSQATITQLKQGAGYIGWVLRADAGGQNFYYVDLNASSGFGGIGLSTPFNLQKFVGGVLQGPPYDVFAAVVPQIGDVFKVQIVGNTISAFQNGRLVGSFTDTNSAFTSGSAGMLLQAFPGIAAITDVAIDNWEGGSIFPAPAGWFFAKNADLVGTKVFPELPWLSTERRQK